MHSLNPLFLFISHWRLFLQKVQKKKACEKEMLHELVSEIHCLTALTEKLHGIKDTL